MAYPKILVTGATGGTGLPLVQHLLAQGFPVRALVRRNDARSASLAGQGAEVMVANLYDPDHWALALRDVQRVYYLPLMEPYMLQSATAFALAARNARLEQVVQMSQWTSHRAHPAALTQQTWLVDQLFATLPGVGHTRFNPGMFAHNFLRTLDFAALLGFYPLLSGDGQAAPISNEDMARVLAVLLTEGPERHAGRSYRPTGPQLLTGRQMAAIIAQVVGHPVLPVPVPIWLFAKVAQQQGVDPYQVSMLRHYMEDMKQGAFAFEGGVTDVVAQLTGAPAESFEATTRRYAALPFARQSARNRLTALLKFMVTPLYPGHNFQRWDQQMRLPKTDQPTLCMEDPAWRDLHRTQLRTAA